MRGRHFPRLCRSCGAPMARQEDSCWRCAAVWDYRSAGPPGRLAVRSGSRVALSSRHVGAPPAVL